MERKMKAVQELKSERVQEEMAAEESSFRVSLKVDRAQEPGVFAAGPKGQFSTAFELNLLLSQPQPVKFELMALGAIITIDGTKAES